MSNKLLISCRNLGYFEASAEDFSSATSWDICKLNLDLHAGERIRFNFETEEQKNVLWRLFERKLKPKKGSFRISPNTHIHTDQSLLDGIDRGLSLKDNLKSKLFEERPWLAGKRKTLESLMDQLGLIGRMQSIPVSDLSKKYFIRFWILMLLTTKTKVFLLDRLLQLLDEKSMSFFLEWIENFPGGIIIFGKQKNIQNAFESSKNKKINLSRNFFNLLISFKSDGEANILIKNKKKIIDNKNI